MLDSARFVCLFACGLLCSASLPVQAQTGPAPNEFTLELSTICSGFGGQQCWVHPRAAAIPQEHLDSALQNKGADKSEPRIVLTTQPLDLAGSDVFYRLHQMAGPARGFTGSNSRPTPIDAFKRQTYTPDAETNLCRLDQTQAAHTREILQAGDVTTVCDFVPKWHRSSEMVLGIGQTVWYRDNRVMKRRPRGIAYAALSPATMEWSDWRVVELPLTAEFLDAGAGSAQRVDLPGGDILLPIYFRKPGSPTYSVTVCRLRFDGHVLHYIAHGSQLTLPTGRGLYEPSLTHFAGKYYLTMRNDQSSYVCTSEDGLHFVEPTQWRFDDGESLGSYNTQQHWVRGPGELYLVYTRRGAENDHVFRHRAPLFMSRVDTAALSVVRDSEQIVVPERGARLGNFGVVDVSAEETWITVAEWMQPDGVEEYGSDNSIFAAKIHWDAPRPATAPPGDWLSGYSTPPPRLSKATKSYGSGGLGNLREISLENWPSRRDGIEKRWHGLLGAWPPLVEQPTAEVLSEETIDKIRLLKVRFEWMPGERTTGYLLIPGGEMLKPAVLTVFYEPDTAIGRGKPNRDFAIQLARRGFVTLSIGTTQATAAKQYSLYYPSVSDAQVQPISMLAHAAANAWHVLADRPEVDQARIGIVGHSFGGKWAMFAGCLYEKFSCVAFSDPGIVFDQSRPSVNYWEPWYLGYHPPPWRSRGMITTDNPARGLYPQLRRDGIDLHELHALLAPRPFLVSGGSEDPIHRWHALGPTVDLYKQLGMSSRIFMTNRPEHSPNLDSNQAIYAFFKRFLEP